ncbi:hypothetical protein [Lacipirellula parvula]|uniref:Uncharacterized protein n=1 Tax=Lacipirellula parvula TaxID=2650471 RepID=A0A5K7XIA7_9BACT|nr:hypothetical protein [Lacipirellula parvula]BBO35717.1 hypothetical protein PLANPX_5329 [Lacipirellula parvula]
MAASLFPASHRPVVSWFIRTHESLSIRWHRSRQRKRSTICPICSPQLEQQAAQLLNAGFYQASVASNRLRLELIAVAYYKEVVRALHKKETSRERIGFGWVVDQLLEFEEVIHVIRIPSRPSCRSGSLPFVS